MSKEYINKNLTINDKNKTLEDLCNDIESAITKIETVTGKIENIQNSIKYLNCMCFAGGSNDISITIPSQWSYVKVPLNSISYGDSSVFVMNNGGIKVLIDGFYEITGSVNIDNQGVGGSSGVYTTSHGFVNTCDMCGIGSAMINFPIMSCILWLPKNAVIYPAIRMEQARTYNIRLGRTVLKVEKI